ERKGSLSIAPIDSGTGFDVRATEKWSNGAEIAWTGSATISGTRTVVIRRSLELDTRGLTGVVAGDADAGPDAVALEYSAEFDSKDVERADLKIFRIKTNGAREEFGTGKLREKRPFWHAIPGDLIALGKKTLEKKLHDPESLKKDFSLGSYVHIGVK